MNIYYSTNDNSILQNFEKSRSQLADGRTRVEYKSGCIEEFTKFQDYFQGARINPNGAHEQGTFDYKGSLIKGKKIDPNGVITYVGLKRVFYLSNFLNKNQNDPRLTLNFLPEESTKQQLCVFEEINYGLVEGFIPYQDQSPELITKLMLQHINAQEYEKALNSLGENTSFYLQKLCEPNSNFNGSAPINKLLGSNFRATLNKFQEFKYKLDLQKPDAVTGKSLFEIHCIDRDLEIVKDLINLDPQLLIFSHQWKKTPLVRAFLRGNEPLVSLYLNEMKKQHICLNIQEKWLKKAFKNITSFNNLEFSSLDQKFQKQIYRTANLFSSCEFVTKLNSLGMIIPTSIPPVKPGILSYSMDAACMKNEIIKFFSTLRSQKRLLTLSEFEVLNKKNDGKFIDEDEIYASPDMGWFKKNQFGLERILGRDYVQKKIDELNSKHIKVPQKIAVIKDSGNVRLTVQQTYKFFTMDSSDLDVYVQKIQRTNRTISREEMEELIMVIESTGYCDIGPYNFIVAADGIYFIDTEFKSFENEIQWEKLARLSIFLDNENKKWFEKFIGNKTNRTFIEDTTDRSEINKLTGNTYQQKKIISFSPDELLKTKHSS